jgi:O-antigen ligase
VPALLIGVGVTGVLYGTAALVTRRLLLGVYVATIVLSTFAANVPLGAESYLSLLPGSLGPQLWLLELPLVVLLAHHLRSRRFSWENLTSVELVLGGFVLWTVVSALLSVAPRPDVALYYSLLMIHVPVAFAVTHRGVIEEEIGFQSVVSVFLLTVIGHLPVALAQLINQQPLGLSPLGESVIWANVNYPPFGFVNRVITSGLTGHGYVLVALLLIAIPVVTAYLMVTSGRRRVIAVGLAILMAAFLRISTSDAGRGAIMLTIVITSIMYVLYSDYGIRTRSAFRLDVLANHLTARWRTHLSYVITTLSVTLLVLYPSSKAGTSSRQGDSSQGSPGGDGSPPTEATGDTVTREVPNIGELTGISDISLPLFNLANLGSRLQQYAVGIDLFLRNPILGVGGGNYPFLARWYGVPNKASIPIPQPLHNVYLGLLVETGIPGFLLYTTGLVLVLLAGWGAFREETGLNRVLAAGLTIGFIGVMGFNFWTHSIDKITMIVPFWLLAGALVAVADQHSRDESSGEMS